MVANIFEACVACVMSARAAAERGTAERSLDNGAPLDFPSANERSRFRALGSGGRIPRSVIGGSRGPRGQPPVGPFRDRRASGERSIGAWDGTRSIGETPPARVER